MSPGEATEGDRMELLRAQARLEKMLKDHADRADQVNTKSGSAETRLLMYELRDALRGDGRDEFVAALGPEDVVEVSFFVGQLSAGSGQKVSLPEKKQEPVVERVKAPKKAEPEKSKKTEPVSEPVQQNTAPEPQPEVVVEEVQEVIEPSVQSEQPTSGLQDLAAMFKKQKHEEIKEKAVGDFTQAPPITSETKMPASLGTYSLDEVLPKL